MRVKSTIQWCTLIFKEYSYLGIFVIVVQIIKLILGCDRVSQIRKNLCIDIIGLL